ncbi:MAG: porin family protein [Alphaproteobacteria bacterium]|nr:porin family protein [Alphaproteobacteria bacterium]
MNKYLLTALLSFALLPLSVNAQNVYTPYVGVEGLYGTAKAGQIKPHYFGAAVNVGTMYNPYFSTELFYEQTGSDSKKISDTQKLKTAYRAYGLDATGYLPLGCDKRFSLFASLGMGEYVVRKKLSPDKHHNNNGYAYRIGLGAQYALTEHFSLKLTTRYMKFHRISGLNHGYNYGIGLRYHFTKD